MVRAWFEKKYFKFEEDSEWRYRWVGQDWSKLYFAWTPKFIVQSLVKLYWRKEWEEIFTKFMKWIAWIKDIEFPGYRKDSPATFVLYRKLLDENKSYKSGNTKEVYDWEEEPGENGEDIRTQDLG